MSIEITALLATFLTPMKIETTGLSMLWALPLIASIAVVYKATKVNKIEFKRFFKESAILFGSIVIFLCISAVVLCVIFWFINEKLPSLMKLC